MHAIPVRAAIPSHQKRCGRSPRRRDLLIGDKREIDIAIGGAGAYTYVLIYSRIGLSVTTSRAVPRFGVQRRCSSVRCSVGWLHICGRDKARQPFRTRFFFVAGLAPRHIAMLLEDLAKKMLRDPQQKRRWGPEGGRIRSATRPGPSRSQGDAIAPSQAECRCLEWLSPFSQLAQHFVR